jgi:NTP pyrophosphatase (non-canonical NTP hydrolase)
VRAQLEIVEALRAHSTGSNVEHVLEELADTMIVLHQLARLLRFDVAAAVAGNRFKVDGSVLPGAMLTYCNKIMAGIVSVVESSDISPFGDRVLTEHFQRLVVGLFVVATMLGGNLHRAIDSKMEKNRTRTWERVEETGAHVRVPA